MQLAINDLFASDLVQKPEQFADKFQAAKPFKHLVLSEFFSEQFARQMLENFPIPPDLDSLRNEFGGGSRKHSCSDVRSLGHTFCQLDDVLASPEFSRMMSKLTGIERLIYDPEYIGGGTHNNFEGQGMYPHVDFNYHPTTGYHRRLNAIVYLTDEWQESWGGSLELHSNPWDGESNNIKVITPAFGTCVVFETSEHSWHGFEKIALPDHKKGQSRKSFAIYMYTKDRPQEEVFPKHATIYVQKPLDKHIVAGHTMTCEDVEGIQNNFTARNAYLKSLYDRETKFISTIAVLQRQIERYKENYYAPVTGSVIQIAAEPAPYPDCWVERSLTVQLRAEERLTSLDLITRVPTKDFFQTLTLTVDGKDYEIKQDVKLKTSNIELSKRIKKGKKFTITLRGQLSISLAELGISGDKRRMSFRLETMRFLTEVSSSRLRLLFGG